MTTDRATSIIRNGATVLVIFGRMWRGEFVVSHSKPSRSYKTMAGANRAADKWITA